MNDDVERKLENPTPRGAPPALRARALRAVDEELRTDSLAPWERKTGWLVAATVLVGILSNLWAVEANQECLAELAGPKPMPEQLAEVLEAVESVAGPEASAWVRRRFANVPHLPPASTAPAMREIEQQLFHDLEITGKDDCRGKIQEVPQERRDRTGSIDRPAADRQRDPDLDCRWTA